MKIRKKREAKTTEPSKSLIEQINESLSPRGANKRLISSLTAQTCFREVDAHCHFAPRLPAASADKPQATEVGDHCCAAIAETVGRGEVHHPCLAEQQLAVHDKGIFIDL